MPLSQGDSQFKVSWPSNTTPQAPDGSGTTRATLCGFTVENNAAASRAVKFYDKASSPTVGTDIPKRTVIVPAGQTFVAEFRRGKTFQSGLWVSVTVNAADADATAPTAGDIILTVDFG